MQKIMAVMKAVLEIGGSRLMRIVTIFATLLMNHINDCRFIGKSGVIKHLQ